MVFVDKYSNFFHKGDIMKQLNLPTSCYKNKRDSVKPVQIFIINFNMEPLLSY